jgi:hypothetical protein
VAVGEPADAVGRALDERLAAPARVDGHAEREVGLDRERPDRRARVDRDAGARAGLADRVHREVDVRRGLDVEGDVVGAGLDVLDGAAVRPVDHQVDVEHGLRGERLAQRVDDDRAERDRRDEVAVHDVAVDQPGARGHDLLHLGGQAGEVGGEDAGRDAGQTGHSIEPPQLAQVMFAVDDIRTIVECSPQSGQTERSS